MKLRMIGNGEQTPPKTSLRDHIEAASEAAAVCDLAFLESLPIQKGEITKERARMLAERFNLRHQ